MKKITTLVVAVLALGSALGVVLNQNSTPNSEPNLTARPLSFGSAAELRTFLENNSATDLEVVKNIVAYVAINMDPKTGVNPLRENSSVDGLIASGWGACGVRDNIIRAVLADLNIETRRIGFTRVPIQNGHVATEFLIDGEWVFMDSTFGVYFTDQAGKILSISQARMLYPNIVTHQVAKDIWSKTALSAAELRYVPVSENKVYSQFSDTPAAFVDRTYFISDYWGGDGAKFDDNINFVDLRSENSWRDGEIDGSSTDMLTPVKYGSGVEYNVLPERVGMYFGGNIRQVYNIATDTELMVEMRLNLISPADLINFFADLDHYVIDQRGEEMYDMRFEGNKVSISFKARPPLSTIKLSAPWNGAVHTIDSIEWRVIPADGR
jgi:hypothetical protein